MPFHRPLSDAIIIIVCLVFPIEASLSSTPVAAIFNNLLGRGDEKLPPPPPPPPPPRTLHSSNLSLSIQQPPLQPNYYGPQLQQQQPWQQYSDHQYHHQFTTPELTHNLTLHIAALEQRDELHLRQLDVLTERILLLDATMASTQNQLLEYQANCSNLAHEIVGLEKQVDEWREQCSVFAEQNEEQAKKIGELKQELKAACFKAQDLAALIERHKLESYDEPVRKKTKRGFFSWLFGFVKNSDEDELGEVYEEARSTLLDALQTERNNVDELESAVAALQQNNSAIAEQVKSRDLIIDELNDRIAVFEEDKVVLKAALRQLQKDMSEEAPKTKKLMEDLKASQQEVRRLEKEMNSLIKMHQDEIAKLNKAITAKQDTINATQSNLTVIGTYVDRLEARLADFAVARRDIELREKKCDEIEKRSKEVMQERDDMKSRVQHFESEHEELKDLLQDLVGERTKLRNHSRSLVQACDDLKLKENQLQQSLSKLKSERDALQRENTVLKTSLEQLENNATNAVASSQNLQNELGAARAKIEDLTMAFEKLKSDRNILSEKLARNEAEKAQLEEELNKSLLGTQAANSSVREQLEQKLQSAESLTQQLQNELASKVQEQQSAIASLHEALDNAENAKSRIEEDYRQQLVALEESKRQSIKELEQKLLMLEESSRKTENEMREKLAVAASSSVVAQSSLSSFSTSKTESESVDFWDGIDFQEDPAIHLSLRYLQPNIVYGSYRNVGSLGSRTVTQSPAFVKFPLSQSVAQIYSARRYRRTTKGASLAPPLHKRVAAESKQHGRLSPNWPTSPIGPAPRSDQPRKRNVPLRKVRKLFSRATGIHGLFTEPSSRLSTFQQQQRFGTHPAVKGAKIPTSSGPFPSQPISMLEPARNSVDGRFGRHPGPTVAQPRQQGFVKRLFGQNQGGTTPRVSKQTRPPKSLQKPGDMSKIPRTSRPPGQPVHFLGQEASKLPSPGARPPRVDARPPFQAGSPPSGPSKKMPPPRLDPQAILQGGLPRTNSKPNNTSKQGPPSGEQGQ